MDKHISYQKGGSGYEGWIQPVCTCGWEGHRHYAYNDYQHSNAREQAEQHARTTHE